MTNVDALIEHMAETGGASVRGDSPVEAVFFRQVVHDGDSRVVKLRAAAADLDPRAFARWRPTLLDETGVVVGMCVGADPDALDLDFLVEDVNAAAKLADGVLSGAVIGTRRATPRTAKLVDRYVPSDATFKYLAGGELTKRAFASARASGDPTLDALRKIHAAGPSRYGP
jgi:hypothetical protein